MSKNYIIFFGRSADYLVYIFVKLHSHYWLRIPIFAKLSETQNSFFLAGRIGELLMLKNGTLHVTKSYRYISG